MFHHNLKKQRNKKWCFLSNSLPYDKRMLVVDPILHDDSIKGPVNKAVDPDGLSSALPRSNVA
ncbi:hypothetical protein OUZ56_001746 [Daphnia magna]|uniref:Uncharacterized protein n=1 Tax=Daphnia magna TaxID=35525 RepID=A0ABR0A3L4_9CRUS|nr:hypothetical protein OUZ56_001746 [Daphnia magna]